MSVKPVIVTPLTEEQILAATIGERLPHNGTVDLAEYDPEWPALYEGVRQRVEDALGNNVVMIEHVGSTSIPGMPAKPRLDVLLVVENSADEAAYVPALETAGYWLRIREEDWNQHRLLKGRDPDLNLHVFSRGCPEIERMLLFRDWLRQNESDCKFYEQTKRELAGRTWKYVQNYADAKSSVVEEIIARARSAK